MITSVESPPQKYRRHLENLVELVEFFELLQPAHQHTTPLFAPISAWPGKDVFLLALSLAMIWVGYVPIRHNRIEPGWHARFLSLCRRGSPSSSHSLCCKITYCCRHRYNRDLVLFSAFLRILYSPWFGILGPVLRLLFFATIHGAKTCDSACRKSWSEVGRPVRRPS